MDTSIIVTIISSLGGFKLLEWLFNIIFFREQNERKINEDIKQEELETEKERLNILSEYEEFRLKTIDKYELKIDEKDKKIMELYKQLREETNRRHEVELQLKETELRRCNVRGCTQRTPPSEY